MPGFDDGGSYASRRDCDRPWGYWLRPIETPAGGIRFVDEDGRRWASAREAFWTGRLGMRWSATADGQLDILREVMEAVADDRDASSVFRGVGTVLAMLVVMGLAIDRSGIELTREGRAVLAMLRMAH